VAVTIRRASKHPLDIWLSLSSRPPEREVMR
jgi:hypothetical protein